MDTKRGWGPKLKYVISTEEEAPGAHRERSRKTALDSYYMKKEQAQTLDAERQRLLLRPKLACRLIPPAGGQRGGHRHLACCRTGNGAPPPLHAAFARVHCNYMPIQALT